MSISLSTLPSTTVQLYNSSSETANQALLNRIIALENEIIELRILIGTGGDTTTDEYYSTLKTNLEIDLVDNTSDLMKPVSELHSTELNKKVETGKNYYGGVTRHSSDSTTLTSDLATIHTSLNTKLSRGEQYFVDIVDNISTFTPQLGIANPTLEQVLEDVYETINQVETSTLTRDKNTFVNSQETRFTNFNNMFAGMTIKKMNGVYEEASYFATGGSCTSTLRGTIKMQEGTFNANVATFNVTAFATQVDGNDFYVKSHRTEFDGKIESLITTHLFDVEEGGVTNSYGQYWRNKTYFEDHVKIAASLSVSSNINSSTLHCDSITCTNLTYTSLNGVKADLSIPFKGATGLTKTLEVADMFAWYKCTNSEGFTTQKIILPSISSTSGMYVYVENGRGAGLPVQVYRTGGSTLAYANDLTNGQWIQLYSPGSGTSWYIINKNF